MNTLVKVKKSEFSPEFEWCFAFTDIRTGKKFLLKYMDNTKAVYTRIPNDWKRLPDGPLPDDEILIIENK